jgi:hypothetical protein
MLVAWAWSMDLSRTGHQRLCDLQISPADVQDYKKPCISPRMPFPGEPYETIPSVPRRISPITVRRL